jgi:CBS domain containing-hemolysin-like protein
MRAEQSRKSSCNEDSEYKICILFFSEVLPKTLGVVYCRPLSMVMSIPLLYLVKLFLPIIWICGFATRAITGNSEQNEVSSEEIVVMARLGEKSGSIQKEEMQVIKNILTAHKKPVHDIMTPRSVIFSLDSSMTIEQASQQEGLYKHSRVPVYVDTADDIVGIVYRRDILSAISKGNQHLTIREYMKPVSFVLDSLKTDLLLELFLDKKQHLFAVLNEFNDLIGVVTLEDVLEEILGEEIIDEFDEAVDMRALAQQRRKDLLAQKGPIHS